MQISFNTYNHIPYQTFRQEKFLTSFASLLTSKFLQEIFSLKANNKRTSKSQVMNELLYRVNAGKSMKVSQLTIATKLKLTRLHVGKLLRELESDGCIKIHSNGFHQSKTYEINPFFWQEDTRIELQNLLPELNIIETSLRKKTGDFICTMKVANMAFLRNNFLEKHHSLYGINFINSRVRTGVLCEPEEGANCVQIPQEFEYFDGQDWAGPEKEENIYYPAHSPIQFEAKKEEKTNNEASESVMKNYELKSIKLTEYGQIRLQAFPEEAIYAIDKRMLHMKERPAKPWNYFVAACKRYCEENGLEMDWTTTQQLLGKNCVPDHGPFVDDSFIPSPPTFFTKKTSPKSSKEGRIPDMEKSMENERRMVQFGLDAMARQQCKQMLEWEETQQREPLKFERWSKAAVAIRESMGLREDGTFLTEEAKQLAVEVLVGANQQKSDKSVCLGIQKSEKHESDYVSNAVSVCMDYRERLVEEMKKWSDSKGQTRVLISWFIRNLKNLPEDYEKTYMLIKQILESAPTEQSERILIEVVSNLKRIVDEEYNQEALA